MTVKTIDFHGHYEQPPIEPDDIVLGANKVYVVITARPVESRQWPERWRVELRPVGPRDQHTRALVEQHAVQGSRCIELGSPYRRGEKPGDDPCNDPTCTGCREGARDA